MALIPYVFLKNIECGSFAMVTEHIFDNRYNDQRLQRIDVIPQLRAMSRLDPTAKSHEQT